MAQVDVFGTATVLSSGGVLVAGGQDNVCAWSTAESYDPVAGTRSPARAGRIADPPRSPISSF